MGWRAKAPGKLMLLGEYAVLDGAPALVLAVDRYCQVELSLCGADEAQIDTPELDQPPLKFQVEQHRLVWSRPPAGGQARTARLIESIIACRPGSDAGLQPFRMRIDTAALFHGPAGARVKLGLGSSAASAVAIDAALGAAFGETAGPSGLASMPHLLDVTRAAQGGQGSGADLAASLCGGLISYRIGGNQPSIRRQSLPDGLVLVPVWTGLPASTGDLVAAWRRAARHRRNDYTRLLAAMRDQAQAGLQAVEGADGAALLACWSEYGRIMGKMNDLVDQPVVTAEHELAAGIAASLGGVYKPCGAGGGDVGLAAALDPLFDAAFREACRQAGLETLSMQPSAAGLQLRREKMN